jgi:hypothetical protein
MTTEDLWEVGASGPLQYRCPPPSGSGYQPAGGPAPLALPVVQTAPRSAPTSGTTSTPTMCVNAIATNTTTSRSPAMTLASTTPTVEAVVRPKPSSQAATPTTTSTTRAGSTPASPKYWTRLSRGLRAVVTRVDRANRQEEGAGNQQQPHASEDQRRARVELGGWFMASSPGGLSCAGETGVAAQMAKGRPFACIRVHDNNGARRPCRDTGHRSDLRAPLRSAECAAGAASPRSQMRHRRG